MLRLMCCYRRNKGFDNFEMLDKASRDLLYKECKGCDKEHAVLWMTLELMKLKAINGWTDTSFLALLKLITKVLPKPNGLPSSIYHAKKIICLLTLGIEKNLCLPEALHLIQKKHRIKDRCPRCNASWYKQNDNSEEVKMTPTKSAKKVRAKEEECHS
jgi:hypothetical protein